MQGVHDAAFDRIRGRDERLTQHLTAEHLRAADIPAFAPKEIDLEAFELEQIQEIGDRLTHGFEFTLNRI
jgi:hypothetical protein